MFIKVNLKFLMEHFYRCGHCGEMEFTRLNIFNQHQCTKHAKSFQLLGQFAFGVAEQTPAEVHCTEQQQTAQLHTEQRQSTTQLQPLAQNSTQMTSFNLESKACPRVTWKSDMIRLLLTIYKDCRELYENRKLVSKNDIYKEASKILATHGYAVHHSQVKTKLVSLEKKYKDKFANKGSKQSGRGTMKLQIET